MIPEKGDFLPALQPGEAAVRNYKKGQEVEAIVLGIDVERERISLGVFISVSE